MPALGNLLRKLRGKETLRDAAKRIGVSHTYLSILEKGYDPRSGKPVKPTADTLKLISKAYNFEYKELLRIAGILDTSSEHTVYETPEPYDYKKDPRLSPETVEYAKKIDSLPPDKRQVIIELLELYDKLKDEHNK